MMNTIQAMPEGIQKAPAEHQTAAGAVFAESISILLRMLAPIVPHFAEELWAALGHTRGILDEPWPGYDEAALVEEDVLIVVQVNGKLRSRFRVAVDTDEAELKERAMADERAARFVGDKPVRKIITVRNKLVNIVV